VDDSFFVSPLQGFCNLLEDGKSVLDRDRAAPEALSERFSVGKLHDEELDPI
jgi:hypothetical protein